MQVSYLLLQIIRSVVGNPQDTTKISLLYGNYLEDDILCKEELLYYSSTRKNIKTYITLNEPPPQWSMGTGFITGNFMRKSHDLIAEEMIREHLPAPAPDIKVIMCGPPPMIKAMMPLLKNVGYTDEMIYSFL